MNRRSWLALPVLCLLVAMAGAACGSVDPDRALEDGLAKQRAGDNDGAAEQYQLVLDVRPADKYANYNLGVIEQAGGRTALAEGYYRAALDTDAVFVPALFNLAIVRTGVGATQEAIDLYRRVLEVQPDDAGAHFNLGILYQQAGRAGVGQAQLNEALRLDPTLAGRLATEPVGASGHGEPGGDPGQG